MYCIDIWRFLWPQILFLPAILWIAYYMGTCVQFLLNAVLGIQKFLYSNCLLWKIYIFHLQILYWMFKCTKVLKTIKWKKIIFSALKSDCKVFVRLPFTFRLNSANCVIKWILTVGFCTFIYVIHFILLNELPSFFYFVQDLKFDLIEIPVFIFMAVIGKILLSHFLSNKSRSSAHSAINLQHLTFMI